MMLTTPAGCHFHTFWQLQYMLSSGVVKLDEHWALCILQSKCLVLSSGNGLRNLVG